MSSGGQITFETAGQAWGAHARPSRAAHPNAPRNLISTPPADVTTRRQPTRRPSQDPPRIAVMMPKPPARRHHRTLSLVRALARSEAFSHAA